jgi:hypothetical protein
MLSMLSASDRRRFRFGLKGLFVLVALVACVLGWRAWCLNWVSQRHEVLNARAWEYVTGEGHPTRNIYAPWPLRIFGETGVEKLVVAFESKTLDASLTVDQQTELDRIRRLFPETEELRSITVDPDSMPDPSDNLFF